MVGVTFAQQLKHLMHATAEPSLVEVPPIDFLMIDGRGDPNHAPEYPLALEALYALAYGVKFTLKRRDAALDFKVPALEGLWWADDMASFNLHDREPWRWTMMIAMPETVTGADVGAATAEALRKGKTSLVQQTRLERYHEGLCAQILHLGPYSAEGPTIERLHSFIAARGYQLSGKHHEIYLGDPRRSAPEKLKTIIRQPVAGSSGARGEA